MSKPIRRTYPLPEGCDAKKVTIRQLMKADELAAAVAADAVMRGLPAGSQNSTMVYLDIQRTENVRQSIVKIDGRPVNVDGIPCMEIDGWSMASWSALYTFYGAINGIPGDELGNCLKAGVDDPEENDGPAPSDKVASTGK